MDAPIRVGHTDFFRHSNGNLGIETFNGLLSGTDYCRTFQEGFITGILITIFITITILELNYGRGYEQINRHITQLDNNNKLMYDNE